MNAAGMCVRVAERFGDAGMLLLTHRRKAMPRRPPAAPARPSTPASGTSAQWPSLTLRSWTVGALPLINHFLSRLDLEALLQAHLPAHDGRSRLPVARGLIVLVQNILLSREPLYGLGAWAALHDPQLLGLTPEQIGSLNDDRLGRCLAALFQTGSAALLLALVRHAVQEFGVSLHELHNDSTTISFHGAYADAAAEQTHPGQPAPALTWGHSKARRPDLKQLLYILTLSSDGGVPLCCRGASGNVTDDTTHPGNWDLLCELAGTPDFLYVADGKLVTRANLNHIATRGGRFVSVLPRTRREDTLFRSRLQQQEVNWQPLWSKHNDDGQLLDCIRVADGPEVLPEGYRLWWYHSTRKADLDQASRSNRLERALRHLRQLQAKLRGPRARQRDRAKVQQQVEHLLQPYDVTDLVRCAVVECPHETFHQRRRGRPGPNTEFLRRVRLRLDLDWTIDAAAVDQAQTTDGVFPLVTNDAALTALDALLAYKRQPVIEKRFEQLKTDFAVAPVWLKDVRRIEGLLHVYFIVLLVEALLERELRRGMQRARLASLPLYPEGRPCRCPTARRVIDLFAPVQRHVLETTVGATTTAVTDRTPVQKQVLRLLGLPANAYAH
jgi:transposase